MEFYQGLGHFILETNWHFGKLAEVDIISWDPHCQRYHFVEVKTRNAAYNQEGLEQATTTAKKKRLIAAITGYFDAKSLSLDDANVQLDWLVIALPTSKQASASITYLPNSLQLDAQEL